MTWNTYLIFSGLWCLICALLGVVKESLGKGLDLGSGWGKFPECEKLTLVVVADGAQTGGGETERLEQPLLTEPSSPSEQ